MTARDWLYILGFFGAFIAGFAALIIAVMRLERWRAARGLRIIARALDGGRLIPIAGPGAWRLDEVRGRSGGADVLVRPTVGEASPVTIAAGTRVALKPLGLELHVTLGGRTASVALGFPLGEAEARRAIAELPALVRTLRAP